jgi:transposase
MAQERIPGVSQAEWDALPLAVRVHIEWQERRIAALEAQVAVLTARVAELEARLAKDSSNSHKPPSSDGPGQTPRTQSERTRSGRKPGGQTGHSGNTLMKSQKPDFRVRHQVTACGGCSRDLSNRRPDGVVERQVFDLPPVRIQCTSHEAEVKLCPGCGCRNQAPWPDLLAAESGAALYGPGLRALGVYLTQGQLLPYDRTAELFSDLFGREISTGTLAAWNSKASRELVPTVDRIADALAGRAGAVHFDETGAQVAGRRHWLHSASDARLTHYAVHRKRGLEAIEEIGILPRFRGVACHDRWGPYFHFQLCLHGLCGAHLLRDLRFVFEEQGEKWAGRMRKALQAMSAAVNEARRLGRSRFNRPTLKRLERRYDNAIYGGLALHQGLDKTQGELPSPGTRGRKKKRDGKNLVDALEKHRESVLRFLHDFTVPFTNNQGERDIRMTKVKLKISGSFRSLDGARDFCRTRSYLSTGRKQGWNLLEALRAVFLGNPMQPCLQAP